ncbi:hypothetical protein [Natrinema versiforme]|uniref:hypothetical protein n=1 Tax=Natrinema versiforme TaxID=88724 RepID=UPI001585FB70
MLVLERDCEDRGANSNVARLRRGTDEQPVEQRDSGDGDAPEKGRFDGETEEATSEDGGREARRNQAEQEIVSVDRRDVIGESGLEIDAGDTDR